MVARECRESDMGAWGPELYPDGFLFRELSLVRRKEAAVMED